MTVTAGAAYPRGVRAKGGQQMIVTSNEMPVAGDPKDLRLEPGQVIVLRMP